MKSRDRISFLRFCPVILSHKACFGWLVMNFRFVFKPHCLVVMLVDSFGIGQDIIAHSEFCAECFKLFVYFLYLAFFIWIPIQSHAS